MRVCHAFREEGREKIPLFWQEMSLERRDAAILHYIEIKLFRQPKPDSKEYRAAGLRLAEYGTLYWKKRAKWCGLSASAKDHLDDN